MHCLGKNKKRETFICQSNYLTVTPALLVNRQLSEEAAKKAELQQNVIVIDWLAYLAILLNLFVAETKKSELYFCASAEKLMLKSALVTLNIKVDLLH